MSQILRDARTARVFGLMTFGLVVLLLAGCVTPDRSS